MVAFPFSKAYNTSLRYIFDICLSLSAWLSLHPENVAILHCASGVSRIAIAVSSYLCFSEIFSNTADALFYFKYRRQLSHSGSIGVIHQRYLDYVDHVITTGGVLPNPHPVAINRIVLSNLPSYGADWEPGLEFYVSGSLVATTLLKKAHETVSSIKLDYSGIDCIFDIPFLCIKSDVQIRLFRHIQTSAVNQIVTIATFSFHTGFMPATGLVRVSLPDIETAKTESHRFPESFCLDISLRSFNNQNREQASYTKMVDPTNERCLTRLAAYHSLKADPEMITALQKHNIPNYAGIMI